MDDNAKNTWEVEEAQLRLSELMARADVEGPQVITKNGKEVGAVVGTKYSRFIVRTYEKEYEVEHMFDDFFEPLPDR